MFPGLTDRHVPADARQRAAVQVPVRLAALLPHRLRHRTAAPGSKPDRRVRFPLRVLPGFEAARIFEQVVCRLRWISAGAGNVCRNIVTLALWALGSSKLELLRQSFGWDVRDNK